MNIFARLQDNKVVELFIPPEGRELTECFHPEVAALFVSVPAETTLGSTRDAQGRWTIAPIPPAPVPVPERFPVLTSMQLYLALKPTERTAIKRSGNDLVQEFWETLQLALQNGTSIDPNLASVREGVQHLKDQGILADDERVHQVLSGMPQ